MDVAIGVREIAGHCIDDGLRFLASSSTIEIDEIWMSREDGKIFAKIGHYDGSAKVFF
jgi:hypothetical protein